MDSIITITATQRAWMKNAVGDELEAFLALGEPDCGAFSRRDTPGLQMHYAAMLQGVILGEERFATAAEAVEFARLKQQEFASNSAKVVLPPEIADTSIRDAVDTQDDLGYTLDGVFDLRSQYVEWEDTQRTVDGSTLLDVVFNALDTRKPDTSLQPLLDVVPNMIKEVLNKKADDGDSGTEDANYTRLSRREQETEWITELCLAWARAGFFGYLVALSIPVREYRKDNMNGGYGYSPGYRQTGVVYVEKLDTRAPFEAWAAEQIEEFKAQAK